MSLSKKNDTSQEKSVKPVAGGRRNAELFNGDRVSFGDN
jgi:hypothetical protein